MQNLIDGVIRELEQKNYSEAIKYCNKLIAQFPDNYIFYEIKGNCNLETGNFTEAIKNYSDAIGYFKLTEGKSNSNVATLYNRRGYARLKLNLYNDAISDFEKAIEYKPDFAEAYNNCGNAYRKLGLYDEALRQCNKAIEYKPDFAEAYNNRGNIYYLFSKGEEAIDNYTRAIEIRPNYTGAYYNRGAAYYYLQNKLIEAKSDWERVIKLNVSYESELKGRLEKIEETLDEMRREGIIPTVSEPLSLVKGDEMEKAETTDFEESKEVTEETKVNEEKIEPLMEILDVSDKKENVIEKSDELIEEKTEEVTLEKTDVSQTSDFEIPDIDFKNIFKEEEKGLDTFDDLKPLTEIFEQIYQPTIKDENIIPEEVKQLHKEIEDIPLPSEEKVLSPPPETSEVKKDEYIEELIKHEGKSKADDAKLPWETEKKEKETELSGMLNPSYLEDKEKRSIFKSPLFIISLIFIFLVAFALTAYIIYNKYYNKKLLTTNQQITSEQKDTTKLSGNIDSSQIRDTITEKTDKIETKEETKKKEIKEEKTVPNGTVIKGFVVINEKDGIYLQVASLKDKASADKKAEIINKKNVKTKVIEADLGDKGKYYRIRIGPFKNIEEAKIAANKID